MEKLKVGESSIPIKVKPLFPGSFAMNMKDELEKEGLDIFKKVKVNIHLLEAIRQVPRYAKFHKELCINKKKIREDEKVSVGEIISIILQKKLPTKEKDLGMFAIP